MEEAFGRPVRDTRVVPALAAAPDAVAVLDIAAAQDTAAAMGAAPVLDTSAAEVLAATEDTFQMEALDTAPLAVALVLDTPAAESDTLTVVAPDIAAALGIAGQASDTCSAAAPDTAVSEAAAPAADTTAAPGADRFPPPALPGTAASDTVNPEADTAAVLRADMLAADMTVPGIAIPASNTLVVLEADNLPMAADMAAAQEENRLHLVAAYLEVPDNVGPREVDSWAVPVPDSRRMVYRGALP
jgi:hypothetical protein